MGDVHGIRGYVPPGTPDPGIVAELESLLEDARRGKVRALAYVALAAPDSWLTRYKVPGFLLNATLGAIERMKARILAPDLDGREDDWGDGDDETPGAA